MTEQQYQEAYADTLIQILIDLLDRYPRLDSDDYEELMELAGRHYLPITARYKATHDGFLMQVGTARNSAYMGLIGSWSR